jgi:pimeloyl-ACP methyl ester carboxylesterase
MWQPQLAALADYHCLVPDLPEHGRSREAGPFSLDGAALEVAALIRMCAAGSRAHVVGLSLGGAVALTLLRLAPDAVASLLVTGVAAPLPPLVRGLAHRGAGAAELAPRSVLSAAATLPIRLALGPYQVPAASRAALSSDLHRTFTPTLVRHLVEAMADQELPAAATAPTLVLAGARAAARRVLASVRGARGAVVPGAGHLWNLQEPALFVAVLRAWVSGAALPASLEPL